MATSDTNVPQVIVNKLTMADYTTATKNANEFYAVTDLDGVYAETVAPITAVGAITTNNIADSAITNAKIDWSTVADVNYSLTEQATGGTWTDGKTIYKKTINLGAMPNNTTKNVAHNISNFSRLVKIESILTRANGSFYPLPFASNSAVADQIEIGVDSTNVIISTKINWSASSAVATIYYTKSS